MSAFKPTRRELREVQRLATECEIDARVTQQLGPLWYGVHRPAKRSADAFALSAAVAVRGAQA
ncbi:hypothetical protein WCE39_08125 [Luteimonas sp. MJ174]|uniref:hypothetical protein n=1 Tax=Luteimonas sp. MJ174 TaxID=3129237 RepID=UPI0031BA1954